MNQSKAISILAKALFELSLNKVINWETKKELHLLCFDACNVYEGVEL